MPDAHQAVAINAVFLLVSAGKEVQIPFEDEDHRVGRLQIERTLDWRVQFFGGVHHDLMPQRFRDTSILKDILRTAGVPSAPIHKHQSHRNSSVKRIKPMGTHRKSTISSLDNFNHFPQTRLEGMFFC
jgi:hypothetical protein